MNIKNTIWLIPLIAFLFASACEKDVIDDDKEECTKNCDTLPDDLIRWESPFIPQPDPDIPEIFLGGPVISGDIVVYVSKIREVTGQKGEVNFFGYDRFNGELKWETAIPASEMGILINHMTSVGDQIIVFGEHLFLNINAIDGTVHARRKAEDFPDRYSFKNVVDDQIYFTSLSGESDHKRVEVITCDLDFENWQTITTIEEKIPAEDNYLFFKGKKYYTNIDGELIGLFMDENLDRDIYQSTIIAINLSSGNSYQDRLLWKQQIQSDSDLELYRKQKICGDSLFIVISQNEIFGVDLKTGILSYKTKLDRTLSNSLFDYPIMENKTIVEKSPLVVSIINVRTGLETGTIDQVNIPNSGIVPYDGRFYFVNIQRMVSLDPESQEIVWSYTPQKRSSEIFGNNFPGRDGIAIDPENRLLYTTDNRYALCIELPE